MACTWFGEVCSCCCLSLLSQLAATFSQPRTKKYSQLCIHILVNFVTYVGWASMNRTGARTGRGSAVTQFPLDMY